MEIRVREDHHDGFVVSSWLHEKNDGPCFYYDDWSGRVKFIWEYPVDRLFSWLPVLIENKESLVKIKEILRREFSECDTRLRYLLPLVSETFLMAKQHGIFRYLDEDLVVGMTSLASAFGYSRRWFTCYGFLALNLPLGVVELLVPPIKILMECILPLIQH